MVVTIRIGRQQSGVEQTVVGLHALHEQLVDVRAELRKGIGDPRAEVSDLGDPAGP